MEDQVITSTTEPTIVESANTSAENTAGLSQVIDQATPMDSNTTYSNLPKVEYQPNMSPTQNLINEAIQTEHAINQETNAGKAMNSFLTQGYDYDKAEAGSYWVAGAINDNNTQMSFLQTLINEEMYDEMDLQKYYYDTNLATARAYAAQKGKETAYGFYRAAQERALAEGELTGWYMPAEGRYLLGQYTVAQNTLENPDATPEEISKANRVAKAAESWFSANQITTRGIKCLAMMNYEENVRHNTVMGELQKQANDIAARGAAASAASAQLQLRELKFQVEEMELQTGYDFSNAIGLDNDNYIGHKREDYQDLQALRGYSSTADMLVNDPGSYAAVLGASSKEFIDQTLRQAGKSPEEAYERYQGSIGDSNLKQSIKDNGNVLDESYLNKQTYEISADQEMKDISKDDRHVYTFTTTNKNGDPETRAYYKTESGTFKQIKAVDDGTGNKVLDIKLSNGSNLNEKLKFFKSSELTSNGESIRVGTTQDMSGFKGSYTSQNYASITGKQDKAIKKAEKEGYQIVDGAISVDNINANIVMKKKDSDGKWHYYEISNSKGEMKEVTQTYDIHFIEITAAEGTDVGYIDLSGSPRFSTPDLKETNLDGQEGFTIEHTDTYVSSRFITVPTEDGTTLYAYNQPDGSTCYIKGVEGPEGTTPRMVIISQTEAESMMKDKSFSQNKLDYSNGIVATKGGKNADTVAQETEGSKKVETPTVSGGSGGGSDTRNSKGTDYKGESTEADFEKTSVDMSDRPEVLDDINKVDKEKERNNINKVNV